jgi:hypothetical protein
MSESLDARRHSLLGLCHGWDSRTMLTDLTSLIYPFLSTPSDGVTYGASEAASTAAPALIALWQSSEVAFHPSPN